MRLEKIILEPDEKVLIQTRKHWFILFAQLISVLLAAIFPPIFLLIYSLLPTSAGFGLQEYFSAPFILGLYSAWLLILWMMLFGIWTNYYLDVWTITSKRLIVIDQREFFNRTTGSFRLERLQDVNVEINGMIATFLDFGTLEAVTAGGNQEEFRASGLPSPRELKALILEAADQTFSHEDIHQQSATQVGL